MSHNPRPHAKQKLRVLVVEDDADINELLSLKLSASDYEPVTALSSAEARELLKKAGPFDVIVLDWMLDDWSGLDLCKHIRRDLKLTAPIIFLTSLSSPADIVAAFEEGANDYITKPFDMSVFLVRIKNQISAQALLTKPSDPLKIGDISIDFSAHTVRVLDAELHLTQSEFAILACLAKHANSVVPRSEIVAFMNGDQQFSVTERTVDTHMVYLRKKLGSASKVIETIRGVGYKLVYRP